MPELPEVESLRRSLIPFVKEQEILSVQVFKPKLVSGSGTKRFEDDQKKSEFESGLKGKTIKNIYRVAKHLIFELEDLGKYQESQIGDKPITQETVSPRVDSDSIFDNPFIVGLGTVGLDTIQNSSKKQKTNKPESKTGSSEKTDKQKSGVYSSNSDNSGINNSTTDGPKSYLVVHLKMTGQMVYQPKIEDFERENQNTEPSLEGQKNHSLKNSSTQVLDQKNLDKNPSQIAQSSVVKNKGKKSDSPQENHPKNQTFIGGGHPIIESETTLPNKHSHIIFELENGNLYYNDTRMFGYCLYFENYQGVASLLEAGEYGVDPLSPNFDLKTFETKLKTKQGVLKKVFLDQKVVTGLGNIYADEVCFLAGVRPYRKVSSLTKKEIEKLYKAIIQIIPKAVSLGGSSVSDYLLADGSRGNYAREHKVYNRGNLNCLTCGQILKKTVLATRTTVYCPDCQQ